MKWYATLAEIVLSWFKPREHIPVPDLMELRLADAQREVKIELAKQKATELKAANEKAAREADKTIK